MIEYISTYKGDIKKLLYYRKDSKTLSTRGTLVCTWLNLKVLINAL